ncbi:S8/S53 family peptidase [Humitalea sp. 24SJ18S-53]|uniref:S8/S53 family peptidase n=1 Tax=Humitalea sp. 24SJ18S-53 TaxID=3422307 RepID=UPI003D672780
MERPINPRQVLALAPWDKLREAYRTGEFLEVEKALQKGPPDSQIERSFLDPFHVVGLPSNGIKPSLGHLPEDHVLPEYPRLVIALDLQPSDARPLEETRRLILNLYAAVRGGRLGRGATVGADVAIDPAEHWCPGEASYPLFGDRDAAFRLMQADDLGALELPGERRVTLVFVDTGIPHALLPPVGTLRGWQIDPNGANAGLALRIPGMPLTPHGNMVARNASSVAKTGQNTPGVRVLDCPLVPDGITNLTRFMSTAVAAFIAILYTIEQEGKADEAWVLCNAWGVFNPSEEFPAGSYSKDPLHPLAHELVLANAMGVDVVFAAGNCGRFCPNPRCDSDHTGPGRSVHGANAHPDVLTVGAVRNDALWLGYSGQGPGPATLGYAKPNLCAPSQFADVGNAFNANTGTSAACGLAAGAVALLRTRWGASQVPPGTLRGVLCGTAWMPGPTSGWNDRLGFGVLNLAAAARHLDAGT